VISILLLFKKNCFALKNGVFDYFVWKTPVGPQTCTGCASKVIIYF